MPMLPLTGQTNDFLKVVLPACASGNLRAVTAYLDDPRQFVRWIGPHGRTMLWEAARRGQLGIVRLLVEEHAADMRALGCYHRETRVEVSPWLAASLNGKDATSEYLASKGAGLDFLSACFLADRPFVDATLQRDPGAADRPAKRKHRWNSYIAWPLQYAIAGRQSATVERLLAAGADPAANPRILFDAVATEQPNVAELLVAAGADPRATRHRSWLDPVFRTIAQRHGYEVGEDDVVPEKWPELVDACRGNHNAPDDPTRVTPLLAQGYDVNVRDYKGKTALHRASQAGFANITRLLLEHDADLEARSADGDTPLFDAAFYGRPVQIELLAEHGAELDAENDKGETPMFAAVRGGRADCVQKLRDLGASIEHRNAKGKSAIDVANRSRKIGIEEVRRVLQALVRSQPS